jgi:hypothetical protein
VCYRRGVGVPPEPSPEPVPAAFEGRLADASGRHDPTQLWAVTTRGDLPDDHEHRVHRASHGAWSDYTGRILEFEINGYTKLVETARYGREWICQLVRGQERITVLIKRTA